MTASTIASDSKLGSDGRLLYRWRCTACGDVGVWLWHLERATRNGAGHPPWCAPAQEVAR